MTFDEQSHARKPVDRPEVLTSPRTDAQVLKHIDNFIDVLGGHVSPVPASEGVLSIPPRIYREYADEFKALAVAAVHEEQRALYLQMATIWLEAAAQFEAGIKVSDLQAERGERGGENGQSADNTNWDVAALAVNR
jgi:hypothetical protein